MLSVSGISDVADTDALSESESRDLGLFGVVTFLVCDLRVLHLGINGESLPDSKFEVSSNWSSDQFIKNYLFRNSTIKDNILAGECLMINKSKIVQKRTSRRPYDE